LVTGCHKKGHIKDRTEIIHIRRREHESVEEFITRDNLESLQIAGTSEDMMIIGFIQGVRDEELLWHLHGPEGMPQRIEALMAAAKMYVKAEKLVELARSL
jgi:hypothetical protein